MEIERNGIMFFSPPRQSSSSVSLLLAESDTLLTGLPPFLVLDGMRKCSHMSVGMKLAIQLACERVTTKQKERECRVICQ